MTQGKDMRVGYARVSTKQQNLTSQIEALNESSCEKIFQENQSGKDQKRPELLAMLSFIREGDVVTVTRLDRLARSTRDLLDISHQIQGSGAQLEVLNINLDTSTPTGKLMLQMLGAIAEFERELMLERQAEGIAQAKKAGKYRGRARISEDKMEQVKELVDSGVSISAAVKQVGVGRKTYYRWLDRA